jgi:hypothetical protein
VTKDEKQRLVDAASPIQISVCVESPREKLLRDVDPDPTPMMIRNLTSEMLDEFWREEWNKPLAPPEPTPLHPREARARKKFTIEQAINNEAALIYAADPEIEKYEIRISMDLKELFGPFGPGQIMIMQSDFGYIPVFVCPTLPENTFVFVWGGKR